MIKDKNRFCDIDPNTGRPRISTGEMYLDQYYKKDKIDFIDSQRGKNVTPYFFNFISNSTASYSLNKRYYFPTDLAKIINPDKPIKGISIPESGQLSKIPGQPAPTDNVIGSLFGIITLCNECNEILQEIPFSNCFEMLPGSKYYFANCPAVIENSYFTILSGIASDDSNGIAFYFYN